jgi:hypothetical protein
MFVGKDRVRSFGATPTCGALSVNYGTSLPALSTMLKADAELSLTALLLATPDGHVNEQLDPDVLTPNPEPSALAWLKLKY